MENKDFSKGEKKNDLKAESEQPIDYQIEHTDFLHKLIIHPDSKWKSIFDVFVLLLVAYSCITSLLNATFQIVQSDAMNAIYWVVESFFYLDFIFSFFQGFRDVEE